MQDFSDSFYGVILRCNGKRLRNAKFFLRYDQIAAHDIPATFINVADELGSFPQIRGLLRSVSAVCLVDFFQKPVIFAKCQDFIYRPLSAGINSAFLIFRVWLNLFLQSSRIFTRSNSTNLLNLLLFNMKIDLFNCHFNDIGVTHLATSTRTSNRYLLAFINRITQ